MCIKARHWEVDAPADAVTDPRMKDSVAPFYPDYRTSTRMDYGNRAIRAGMRQWANSGIETIPNVLPIAITNGASATGYRSREKFWNVANSPS